MGFCRIDYDAWPRRSYFEHYHRDVPCWYSMTADVDITALLPLAGQVHHGVTDGFHVGRFFSRLQAWADGAAEAGT
ncbi:hypothetical protein H9X91_07870 [Oscillibacter valericigenes]|uniref:Chloramphenicol acetyltransferase n=1 Tax=Oscillibacter valericigenes TaxID=351091 RepID=A0ABS2FUP1_9FIRM|nr:hypothetical protein [Oscillibacter valericigenes]